ncbi:A1AO ATPase, subunit I [Methanobrevibacter arboriphilus JCM 13429 = DSM 1125]|uniref:A-type ATP synthase subunit I n=1 Tax=Methanobrevibacter arboriphilus JCM 13429 = DSM 1125 TaxID=1300164 RepID=A0A1V6N1C2_METAZ|nr:V-type ATP synthase subunit I [Methanobrevibacter arboriphilus]OQD58455.1 A1AO ATPase, subunit I [Methanobrevibacter arboriphilus JCM 13429 = DSM 1125]
MFQTERMRKLKVITLSEYSPVTVKKLHEEGIVQINDISERIQQNPEWGQLLKPSKAAPLTSKISSLLMKATGISELFGDVLTPNLGIKDMISSYINPVIPTKVEVEEIDIDSLIVKAESILGEVESQTSVIEDKIAALDTEASELNSKKDLAEKLKNFDMDLSLLEDSKYTSNIVGRINVESAQEFKKDIKNISDDILILEENDNDKNQIIFIIKFLNSYKNDAYSLLRRFEFEKFEINGLEGSPNELINSADSRLKSIENEKSQLSSELKELADKWDDEIFIIKEQLEIEKDRNEIFATFGETESTTMLEAWVPLKKLDETLALIDSSTDGHSVVEVEEPTIDDDDEVPVLKDNPAYAKPYEFLVDMYAPLKYNAIDPTILVALSFPFFFGFCLTDGFYGIIDALIGYIIFRGLGKRSETMKSFGLILIACGIWTLVLALISNGFVGDFYGRIFPLLLPDFFAAGAALPTTIGWFDAFGHPDHILMMAILTGIIYLNIGFIIGAINNYRYGNKKEALTAQIVWFVLEAGIVFLALGFIIPSIGMIGFAIGGALLVASLGLLLYGGGAYGIMDIFGYMGDIISFSRLLALCLSTGGIAMTVNILTVMCGEMIPFIGIVLAVIVFIFGHIVNLLFQSLGAFISGLRLNYVEFFSQFYMTGKNKFQAFGVNRVYTKLKSDN